MTPATDLPILPQMTVLNGPLLKPIDLYPPPAPGVIGKDEGTFKKLAGCNVDTPAVS